MACKKLIGAQRGMYSVGAHQFELDCSRACELSTDISIFFQCGHVIIAYSIESAFGWHEVSLGNVLLWKLMKVLQEIKNVK